MTGFSCAHCGASLELPSSPAALDAECTFCGRHTTLPADILALRRPRAAPVVAVQQARSGVIVAMVVGVALAMGASFAVLRATRSDELPVVPPPPAARPAQPPPPVPTTAKTAETRETTGEAAVSARLTELHARGCKDVILAPQTTSGEQTIETKLVVTGRCVTVIAATGSPDNVLTVRMSTPLGAPLDAPPPATTVELTVCPKMAGHHPTTIVPATGDTYTVAAIECPAVRKAP
ncbi:MAG: hypothetical protein JWP97_802 [Labilithrix sp.]|nr:hypothetical protein [Labilithrix sp.]